MTRDLTYAQAILEATEQCMEANAAVYTMGLGVTDPKGTFGTTLGLEQRFGRKRVMDMPTSENAMTGVAIGTALMGMRPVMTHQRMDFILLALDQIVNNAAKWHYMFGGQLRVPLVIRLVVGRGWGQGPQHSQSLQALFAHIPGLKVVMPATPHDAKGLLIAAIEDDNPVIYVEHRWLHGIFGPVPSEMYRVPIGAAKTAREGTDVTIVSTSYLTLEALRAADALAGEGISAAVVDVRTIKPLDTTLIVEAVRKTGRLIAVDGAWRTGGFAAEIITSVVERLGTLAAPPRRITFPDLPTPSTPSLANLYYPRAIDIVKAARLMMGVDEHGREATDLESAIPLDVPNQAFTGPF
jgi:acetoin:2,6-dichlorophenolindophenol oxidoreductase subunit beta